MRSDDGLDENFPTLNKETIPVVNNINKCGKSEVEIQLKEEELLRLEEKMEENSVAIKELEEEFKKVGKV